MKVLKSGAENDAAWRKEEICTGFGWKQNTTPCGALLELSNGDLLKRIHTDYSGESETYYGFVCPVCGCFTEVNESKYPSYILSNAKLYKQQ